MRALNTRNKGINIAIINSQNKIPVAKDKLRKGVSKVMEALNLFHKAVSVLISDDKAIAKLNSKFLNKTHPTDVLAFPANGNKYLGDIAVSIETAKKNSKIFKTSTEYETLLYIIHGILHLLGYKDKTKNQRSKMKAKQNRIMKYAHTKG